MSGVELPDRAPALMGAVEGVVAAAALALGWGVAGPWLAGPAWAAIIVGALACDRHSHRGLAALVPVALTSDVLAGAAVGSHVGALALGLLLTPALDVRGERGRVGHGVFMVAMVAGWALWEGLAAVWTGGAWALLPVVRVVVLSVLVVAVITGTMIGAGATREAISRARERRLTA